MTLDDGLRRTAELAPGAFDNFSSHMPREWIDEALVATGGATVRRRRLPAECVIWIVVAIALFRNRSISDVVSKLALAFPTATRGDVAPSAIVQARQRVGEDPIAWLFDRSAQQWAHASASSHRWRGLALYGVDGSTLRVPDSPENRSHFGAQRSSDGTMSSYPIVRVVALMALRSHLLAAVAFGPYEFSELLYAETLWDSLPEDSLTILDKGFLGANPLLAVERGGQTRHWLTRAKSNTNWEVLETYAPRDLLVEMKVSWQARQKDPTLPKTWRARAVKYELKGFPPAWLLTSLLDPVAYPAQELVKLYHERWELEIGYDELKTKMLEREETIRSKSPPAVRQELWGIFLAYNLVRLEMERIATEAGVEPTRISFITALRLIVDEWLWCAVASPGVIPRNLARLRTDLKRYILPPRRDRTYPRAVKLRTSHYPKKKPVYRLGSTN
jgi:hypothetical protein